MSITNITDRERELYATNDDLRAEIKTLEATNKKLLQELINIASAKPSTWEDPSEFKSWAQSRAQAAIARATKEKQT